jgi:hypothetical protein
MTPRSQPNGADYLHQILYLNFSICLGRIPVTVAKTSSTQYPADWGSLQYSLEALNPGDRLIGSRESR